MVKLSHDRLSGIITGYITEPFASNPAIRFPTTIAEFGRFLYVVTYGGSLPSPDFVVRLRKQRHAGSGTAALVEHPR